MFEEFFNLRENPFALAPNPRFIFHSQEHAEALAHLRYWIENREGFVLITGEVGTGKTTALYDLMAQLPAEWSVAFVSNSTLSESELLEEICRRFQIEVGEHASKPRLLGLLERFLQERVELGFGSLLILDEAQNFESRVLEEVRLLSNLEQPDGKLLQIALVGQPELERKLRRPELRQLRQRIGIRYYLGPLSEEETLHYLHHRVKVAGGDAEVLFPLETAVAIHRLTHGIPREINVVASQALITAFVQEAGEVRPEHLRAVVEDFAWSPVYGGELPPPRATRVRWPRRTPAVLPGAPESGQLMSIQEAASSMQEAAISIREAASWIREMAPAAWKELGPSSAGAGPRAGGAEEPVEPKPAAASPPPAEQEPGPAEPKAAAEPPPPAAREPEPASPKPASAPPLPVAREPEPASPKPASAPPLPVAREPEPPKPKPAAEPTPAATWKPPGAAKPEPAVERPPEAKRPTAQEAARAAPRKTEGLPGVPGRPPERRRPPLPPGPTERPRAASGGEASRPAASGASRPFPRPGQRPALRSATRPGAPPAETSSEVSPEERRLHAKPFTFGVVEGRGRAERAQPEPLIGRPSGARMVTPAEGGAATRERPGDPGGRATDAAGAPWVDSLTDTPPARGRWRWVMLVLIALIIVAAGVIWRWRTQLAGENADPATIQPAVTTGEPEATTADEPVAAAIAGESPDRSADAGDEADADGESEDPDGLVSGQSPQASEQGGTSESPAAPNREARPPFDPETAARTQAVPGDFVIQVASFRGGADIIREERERCATYYGLPPVTIVRAIVEDEVWNRVYVGSFRRRSDAEAALARLLSEVYVDGATVRQMGNEPIMP